MDQDIRIGIRMARPGDAAGMASIYVDSWRETYAGILSTPGLMGMSKFRHADHFTARIRNASLRSPALVAGDADGNIYGFIEAGPSREKNLPFEGEVYTLYVAPGHTGQGIGTALLRSVFRLFSKANYGGMVIWALSANPSRFFYEAMGGQQVAERDHALWGATHLEVAYGWRSLELGRTTPMAGQAPGAGKSGTL